MSDGARGELVEEFGQRRQAARTRLIARMLLGLELLVVALAFLDPRNDPVVTAIVHTPGILALGAAVVLEARGYPRIAGWIASWIFWVVVAASTWFFGGLRFEMGTAYIVAIMIAAATLGSRPALFFGGMSAVAATVVTVADLQGILPPSIAPASAINGWISVTISVVIAAALIHVIMRDLSEAASRAEEAVAQREATRIRYLQAQKMEPVGRLAGGVAHDFNNLLTVIRSVSSLLREGEGDDEALRAELLDDLDSAVARAAQMTGQLLSFSRKGGGESTVLDVGAVVRELAPMLSRLVGDEVELEVHTPDEPATAGTISGQLEQVILNLVVNARDAMPQGGQLQLEVERRPRGESETVVLRVRDSGVGMDAETIERAFSPFFTTKPSGTGLGLATVADIVSSLDGNIDVSSVPGQGTSIEVNLPARLGEATPPGERGARQSLKIGGRALLVDDHDLVRRATRHVLEQIGYEVTAVRDGVEALSLVDGSATRTGFDLIVSDMMMPRMGGEALVEALGQRQVSCPILLISGDVEAVPEGLEARTASQVAFLCKPFSRDELATALRALVKRDARRIEASA